MIEELQKLRKWAKEKLAAGQEPPWSWYYHTKLIEAIDPLLSGAVPQLPGADAVAVCIGAETPPPEPPPRLRLVKDENG